MGGLLATWHRGAGPCPRAALAVSARLSAEAAGAQRGRSGGAAGLQAAVRGPLPGPGLQPPGPMRGTPAAAGVQAAPQEGCSQPLPGRVGGWRAVVGASGEAAREARAGPPRLRCGGPPNGAGLLVSGGGSQSHRNSSPTALGPRRGLGMVRAQERGGPGPSRTDGLCFPGTCVNLRQATRRWDI